MQVRRVRVRWLRVPPMLGVGGMIVLVCGEQWLWVSFPLALVAGFVLGRLFPIMTEDEDGEDE